MGRRAAVASLQQSWALVGLSVLVVFSAVAASNLAEIYRSQKDFVAGSLLSLAGFCFGKAFSRSQEQKALELIRSAPTDEVVSVLDREASISLHDRGVFENLKGLEENLRTGSERIGDYYAQQCRYIDHCERMAPLRDALDDITSALGSAADLRAGLSRSGGPPSIHMVEPAMLIVLPELRRHYREAIGRRDQVHDWFATRIDNDDDGCWDLFAVMTSDMVRGERILGTLLGRTLQRPPEEYLRVIEGYLDAALGRAQDLTQLPQVQAIGQLPEVFNTMLGDLRRSIDIVTRLAASPDSHNT